MQLILSDSKNTADEDLETLEVLLTPHASSSTTSSEERTSINGRTQSPAQQLYTAISACADLHPDPSSDDENADGAMGLDYENAAPGAGGWITAENMAQFMDEDGNFRVPEQGDGEGGGVVGTDGIGQEGEEEGLERGLGMGAGRVRRAEEFADAEEVEIDGEDEAKWRRTG